MRILLPVLLVAAFAVSACEPKPKTTGEKVGDAIDELVEPAPKTATEKMGAAVEEAGDRVKDATN
jgi:hypothetical protein